MISVEVLQNICLTVGAIMTAILPFLIYQEVMNPDMITDKTEEQDEK